MSIVDTYKDPETTLKPSNNYRRNYILFEKILHRSVREFEVEFRLCERCGLIFFSPRPDEADLLVKYDLLFAEGDTIAREALRRLVDLRATRGEAIRRFIEPFWIKKTGRAVDVGGADGHCLGALTSEFECGIVDFEKRECWPGIRKLAKTLNELPADYSFDVVLCCHTIEHVPNVQAFMESLSSRLAEGGILYVEVPYGCAGEIYETGNLLTHLNFFSEGSLGFLLEQPGLHVVEMYSGPVLSSKKYLPVVRAVARKDSSRPVQGRYLQEGASITRHQMKRSLEKRVFFANLRLVLSRPIAYSVAFMQFLARNLRSKRLVT